MTEAPERDDDEDLLTMEEVADIARMTTQALRYRLKMRTGPEGFRLGKKRVFRRGKVRAWIKAIEEAQSHQGAA
jgi:predicted DNA-binding transcriptional regulator AlpA